LLHTKSNTGLIVPFPPVTDRPMLPGLKLLEAGQMNFAWGDIFLSTIPYVVL